MKPQSRAFSAPVAILARYRDADLEYFALKVVGRGLFLAIMLMVGFLFVFTYVTGLFAGVNEVVVPTVSVDSSVDLGNLVASTFSRVSGAVVSTSGVLVLLVSALLTAHAIRQGSHRALASGDLSRIKLFQIRTFAVAAALSSLIMLTWLTTLATAIRHRAWEMILGSSLPEWLVDTAKVIAIASMMAIVVLSIAVYVHAITRTPLARRAMGVVFLIAAIFVGTSFALLYTYVGTLVNPRASTGLLLVLALLLWVNIAVRSFLLGLCWIAPFQSPATLQR